MARPITLSTTKDRDVGLILMFLSVVAYFFVPPLAAEFGLHSGTVARFSTPIGVVLMILGLTATFLSRKKIIIEDGTVCLKDGMFTRSLRLTYEGTPTFKLSGYEKGEGRASEVWTVHMVSEGRQYLIDKRIGQQTASRALAEQLAKAVKGGLIESYNGKTYSFSADELDLSFVERVQLYPEMLGSEVPEPGDKVLDFNFTDNGLKVNWTYFRSSLLFELFCFCTFLIVVAFIPLPGGVDGQSISLFEVEMAEGDYRYFIGVGIFTLVSIVSLLGYRTTLELIIPKRVQVRTTIWGIPIRGGRIPLEELEHVAVSVTSRGPYIQLISDKRIIKERMPSTNIARWFGWEIRRRLAELSPEATHVEQSVEMHSF